MWFSAIASYKGGLAHYKVVPENLGIYNAYLERYDGKAANAPVQNIILVRGLKHWSGSIEEQNLLDTIGEVIDRRTKGRLHFTFDTNKKAAGKGRRH